MAAAVPGTIIRVELVSDNLPECAVSQTKDPYKQTPVVDLMVREGYVVAATDYPGLGTPGVHPYLVGTVSAYSILDAVRAARQLDLNAGDRFAVWGASQGGQAALRAAQKAPEYAPELKLVAAAAAVPAINLAGIIKSKNDDKGGGVFISEALYAWSHTYPDANLDASIKPERRCAQGESVQFMRLHGVGHDARNESGVLTVGWLEDRLAGRTAPTSCKK